VAGSTWSGRFSARDTVAVDTPARRATSFALTRAGGSILVVSFFTRALGYAACKRFQRRSRS
jgi:hypothetical protein